MKEKTRILIVAGTVLVGLIAVALLVPGDALDKKATDLSAEQIESQKAIIAESLESIAEFDARGEENTRAYYNEYKILANAYVRIGDIRRAREAYLNLIKYSEDPVQDYIDLVALEEENGNYKEARSVLNAAVAENPTNFDYWNMLLEVERNHFGLEGEALEKKIQEAVKATDRSTGSLVTYAYFLEDKGDYQKALEYWREVAAQNPEYEAIYSEEISNLEALIKGQQTQ